MLQTPLLDLRGDQRAVGARTPRWDDYCQSLLRQIEHGQEAGASVKTMGITSCNSGAGVSTIAANLALVAARQSESPTLLVDANLSSPVMNEQFALRKGAGVAELMNITDSPLGFRAQPTSLIAGLSVLARGACTFVGQYSLFGHSLLAGIGRFEDEVPADHRRFARGG